jgi:hypothetical protein
MFEAVILREGQRLKQTLNLSVNSVAGSFSVARDMLADFCRYADTGGNSYYIYGCTSPQVIFAAARLIPSSFPTNSNSGPERTGR